jgi:hypothetical protein
MMRSKAIDFLPQHAVVARENHSIQMIDGHFWSEFCVYLLVIFALVCLNSFVRFYPETQTPNTQLRDAARFLFPHLNTCNASSAIGKTSSPMHKTSALHIEGREDIQSFAFDLGGSTCACVLEWDIEQYWQRVFYGTKYIVFHCTTAFFGVFCLHRPQWVLIWKLLNEVLEELGNAIVGRWAWTVSVLDMESRYDTLINDILLTAVPFSALGLHLVTVLELPDPIQHPATIDKAYLLHFLRVFAQYNMFLQANQSNIWFGDNKWTVGSLAWEAGQLTSCLLQIALIWLLVLLHKLSSKHASVITVSICVLWAPFVVHGVDYNGLPFNEQIAAILSFSLTGFFICYYQWYIPSQGPLFWISLLTYCASLCIWITFGAIVGAPSDRFYFQDSRWCGGSTMWSTSSMSNCRSK